MKDKNSLQCVAFGSFMHKQFSKCWLLPDSDPSNLAETEKHRPHFPPGKSFQHSVLVLSTFQLLGKVLVPFPAHSRKRFPELLHPSFLKGDLFNFGEMQKHKWRDTNGIKNNSHSKKSGICLLLALPKKTYMSFVGPWNREQGIFGFFHEVSHSAGGTGSESWKKTGETTKRPFWGNPFLLARLRIHFKKTIVYCWWWKKSS